MTELNPVVPVLAVVGPLPQWVYFLVIFAVIFLSAFVVFIWAAFFRNKPKRKHRSRRRRESRKLNPTLAEEGGLPPAREENPADPSTPPS